MNCVLCMFSISNVIHNVPSEPEGCKHVGGQKTEHRVGLRRLKNELSWCKSMVVRHLMELWQGIACN